MSVFLVAATFFALADDKTFHETVLRQENSSVDASPSELRVLTYNVHHCEGTDGKLDVARIARVVSAQKPDLVTLQEVDCKTSRTNDVDQAAELERLTGMRTVFAKAIDFQGGGYGIAVMSRFPIQEYETIPLPLQDDPERRIVLKAIIEVAPRRAVMLVCAHLCAACQESERVAQVKKIDQLFGRIEKPVILAGDLNTRPNSESIRLLKQSWMNATDETTPTYTHFGEKSKLDYIFYRPARFFQVVETQVVDENTASDHCPVLSVFKIHFEQ